MISVKMKRYISLFVLFYLLFDTLAGQEVMTLEQALSIGLKNNYGINIARNRARIEKNNASVGHAGFLPKVDASGQYQYALTNAKVEVISGLQLEDPAANSNLVTAGVNLKWTLFDGLNMFVTYEKLKLLEEMGELSAKIAIENAVAEIIISFHNIICKSSEVKIIREQVGISEFRLDLAKTRFETGSGSELELLKARVELNSDLANLADKQTEFLNSRTYLNELLARDINTLFEVPDTILLADTLRYDTLIVLLKSGNRELQRSAFSMSVHQQEIKSSRARQMPSLDLLAGYNYYRNETEAAFIKYNRLYGPSVGVVAGIRIFDGFNLHREYQNAKISFLNSELQYDRLELTLEAFLKRIFNDYQNQFQLIGFELENVALAQRNMDVALESFSLGAISSLQLREIQKNLLEARLRWVTAKFKTKVKETELLLLCGQFVK